MAGTGAGGATASQMLSALHLGSAATFPAVGALQATIAAEQAAAGAGNPNAATLDLANGLFLQQGFSLEGAFSARLATSFGAQPQPVDFQNDPTGAAQAINGWVSAQTQGIIPAIVSNLDPTTVLALANAVYLKAHWQDSFSPSATTESVFHTPAGAMPSAPFMSQSGVLSYSAGAHYQAVDLPYTGSSLSMLVLLPVGESLAHLEDSLTESDYARIIAAERSANVDLRLPRFHLNLQANLAPVLQALGMTDAFSQAADFSGITTAAPLSIGLVQHDADITVDEQGTVAAAATVVTIVSVSAERAVGPVRTFDADHPFLFFLRDDRTGAVLFAGRLVDPSTALPNS